MAILWIILAVGFLVIELSTVALISLWFVAGALAALIFALVSLLMLLALRPFLRKFVEPHKVPTNVDALLGKEAVVTEVIDNLAGSGAVRLEGKTWTARAANNTRIPAGMVVEVQSVEGVKLMVTPAFVRSE